MAQTKNIVIHGLSGKFGDDIVFRQYGDKTIATKSPGKYPPPTDAQQQHRSRFQQACFYWKGIKNNQQVLDNYKAAAGEGQTAYNIALADFLQGPDIEEIDVSAYTGKPGQIIRIKATDDFKVIAVNVSICNADGTLVEEGASAEGDNGYWIYETQATNDSLDGDKITVTAHG